jgi:hypothetical protein
MFILSWLLLLQTHKAVEFDMEIDHKSTWKFCVLITTNMATVRISEASSNSFQISRLVAAQKPINTLNIIIIIIIIIV